MRSSLALRLIASAGIVSALGAQDAARQANPASPLSAHARQYLQARVFDLGLDTTHDFAARSVHHDQLGEDHIRVDQFYQGVKVFGGEAIIHMREGAVRDVTDALVRGIKLNPTPSLGTSEALAVAHEALAPKGPYATDPTAELVYASIEREVPFTNRRGEVSTRTVSRMALVYHVHTELENGTEETSHTDFFVDAHSGEILKSWNTLETGKPPRSSGGIAGTAAVGSGKSQYSGVVSLDTTLATAGGYALQDMTRGAGGTFGHNATTNLNHATSGTGTIFQGDVDNVWGDGTQYVAGSSTTAANGQTAGVDAAFGIQATWDMYKNVMGRNGIDNAGKASYLRVHYSNAYDNAFWSSTCFCMTFGDGSSFTTLTSVDVAGHEMSHGVNATSANLTYSGESGGLNEGNSDILGTMVEFYDLGGGFAAHATTIPATGGNFTIGEQLSATPLRYMYKPSLDGISPDFWYSGIGSLDVHYSSGVANHFFYLLSQGTTNLTNTSNGSSFSGIGNDHAAHIWYLALTGYFTSSTNYAQARTATLSAAAALYGAASTDYATVAKAWSAVNVN